MGLLQIWETAFWMLPYFCRWGAFCQFYGPVSEDQFPLLSLDLDFHYLSNFFRCWPSGLPMWMIWSPMCLAQQSDILLWSLSQSDFRRTETIAGRHTFWPDCPFQLYSFCILFYHPWSGTESCNNVWQKRNQCLKNSVWRRTATPAIKKCNKSAQQLAAK